MYTTRKRGSDGIFDPRDVQVPRKCTDYLTVLCWTAQQRKPQSQSKNQGRLNLSLTLQDQQGSGRTRVEVSAMEDVPGSQEEIRVGTGVTSLARAAGK